MPLVVCDLLPKLFEAVMRVLNPLVRGLRAVFRLFLRASIFGHIAALFFTYS